MPNGRIFEDQAPISERSSNVLFRARGGKLQGGDCRARADILTLSPESVGVISREIDTSTVVDKDVGEGGGLEITVLVLMPMLSG